MQRRSLIAGAALLGVVALLLAPTSVLGAKPAEELPLALCAPDEHTFSPTVTNPFFPLPVGQVWTYSGKEQGEQIGLQITVLNEVETVYRGRNAVLTRVVEEVEWLDAEPLGVRDPGEELIEISRNYFAQTEEGTVCYFGETVDIYENGVIVSHEGAWRADERGNAPGIFMPATPEVGTTFQQEVAPDVAQDRATIVGAGSSVRVPAGTFTDTITVRDSNPLDGSKGTKAYARNVGLVVDGPLNLIDY